MRSGNLGFGRRADEDEVVAIDDGRAPQERDRVDIATDGVNLAPKPIKPEKATITPVMRAPTTKTLKRKRATGMPRVEAVSSPIVIALSWVALEINQVPQSARIIRG